MAEGFVTRRGMTSSGFGELNVWTGDSPPQDKVGVFVESTIHDPDIYIVPYGSMEEDGIWTTDPTPMPIGQVYKFNPVLYNGIIYIFCRDRSIYSFDPATSAYSQVPDISIASPYYTASFYYFASTILGSTAHLINYTGNYNYVNDTIVDLESKTVTYATLSRLPDDILIPVASTNNGNVFVFLTEYDNRDADAIAMRVDSNKLSIVKTLAMQTGTAYSILGNGASFGEFMYLAAVKDYSTKLIYGMYRYNMNTNSIQRIASYYNYNPPGVMFASESKVYAIDGTTVITLDLTSLTYTASSNAVPANANTASYTVGVDTGTEYIAFGCGSGYNTVIRNKYVKSDFDYPSVIVENGTEQNQAEIISGDNGTSIINVRNVYVNESGSPALATGQVRVTGGSWTAIT